ncbi:hypothetical protein BDQ94DRAFT_91451 [Aspergillus welwitschiae]|uniref:Uncharacterized protein n=1 Tax=Aspergillus welwitschiae TaxID=1341132 RepID=A0A3F3QEA5_9EURO|nr:hypothetical protein BDQ94DRAFT_91451 [Aspergillus welwitschiae]RDH37614.1 hypothetical protein BDQ94DRAFT_91451 [Aspergillus welwitschiae]
MNQTNKGHDHTVRYQPQGSLHLASALFALLGKACIALPSCMVMVSSVSYGIFLLNTRWMDARKTLGSRTHHTHTLALSLLFLSLSLSLRAAGPSLLDHDSSLSQNQPPFPHPPSLSHTHTLSLFLSFSNFSARLVEIDTGMRERERVCVCVCARISHLNSRPCP